MCCSFCFFFGGGEISTLVAVSAICLADITFMSTFTFTVTPPMPFSSPFLFFVDKNGNGRGKDSNGLDFRVAVAVGGVRGARVRVMLPLNSGMFASVVVVVREDVAIVLIAAIEVKAAIGPELGLFLPMVSTGLVELVAELSRERVLDCGVACGLNLLAGLTGLLILPAEY